MHRDRVLTSTSSMSRAPPFPTRRARSPSLTNGNSQQSSTKPLQIGRLPSRPTTPSNGSSHYVKGPTGSPNSNSSGPSRPQRSEFRSRQSGVSDVPSDYSRDYYRDSMSTTRSDVSTPHRPRPGTSTSNTPGGPRLPPPRSARGLTEDETTSPTLASAISAFQFAGVRKRAMTNGSDDLNYERERQQEIEEDKARQKRIRDKMPGRQPTSARTGEIDGMSRSRVRDQGPVDLYPTYHSCVGSGRGWLGAHGRKVPASSMYRFS